MPSGDKKENLPMWHVLHDWLWTAADNGVMALVAFYCFRRGLRELLK